MNKKTKQDLKELKAIHERIQYIMDREAYLVEYIEDLGKSGELAAKEIIARAGELRRLASEYEAENVKLNTLILKISYEDRIADLSKQVKDLTNEVQDLKVGSLQDLGR
jgi:hypothetical protein